jgi:hypothetical protein
LHAACSDHTLNVAEWECTTGGFRPPPGPEHDDVRRAVRVAGGRVPSLEVLIPHRRPEGPTMNRLGLVSAALGLVLLAAPALAQKPDDSTARSFVYKKVKDVELSLYVHMPKDWKESDKRPVIVFFFGGCCSSGRTINS